MLVKGPRVTENQPVQSTRGAVFRIELIRVPKNQAETDRALLIAQETCLIAGRDNLLQYFDIWQGGRFAKGDFCQLGLCENYAGIPPLFHNEFCQFFWVKVLHGYTLIAVLAGCEALAKGITSPHESQIMLP
jgi:hypothetical protein